MKGTKTMLAQKYTIGSQFTIYRTVRERKRGHVAQDIFVTVTKTFEIVGKFCDDALPPLDASQGLENVLNYYWIEAQEAEPGCAVKEVASRASLIALVTEIDPE